MVDSSDERDFHRMAIECRGFCREVGTDPLHPVMVRNLSGTGMLLQCAQRLDVGQMLEVSIPSEDRLVAPLHAIVEVLRVEPRPDGAGCDAGCAIREMIT
ncbi:MAG: PilZ domain-containing protein [Gammaproteobacteria bacterium]